MLENSPFWCTVLLFTRADGNTPIPPIVVHQKKEFTADLNLYLSNDWLVLCTQSGYMDNDGWLKSMKLFTKLSAADSTNIQVLFFDGHDSHWDADALDHLSDNHVEAFF